MLLKLKETVARHQFEISLQAAVGSKILAKERIAPFRKDVLIKSGKTVGGGDITRKQKLLQKQKEGKKKMKVRSCGAGARARTRTSVRTRSTRARPNRRRTASPHADHRQRRAAAERLPLYPVDQVGGAGRRGAARRSAAWARAEH